MTASTARCRSGSSASAGTRYGMRAARILPLARTSRWAMVGSGTRNACAISAVLSPPSSRSVSATWAPCARAGWQQVKISRSLSSLTAAASAGSSCACSNWAWACLSSRDASRRSRSIARFLAVVMIQPAGLGGIPADGHRAVATVNASWTDSSAMSISPNTRTRTATARPYSSRKTRSIALASTAGTAASVPGFLLERPHLDRLGTRLARPGRHGQRGVQIRGLDHPEPADVLLALGERAVSDHHIAAGSPDYGRGARRVQPAGEDPGPGGLHLSVERGDVLEPFLDRLGRRRGAALHAVHAEQVLLHRMSPFQRAGGRPARSLRPCVASSRATYAGPAAAAAFSAGAGW